MTNERKSNGLYRDFEIPVINRIGMLTDKYLVCKYCCDENSGICPQNYLNTFVESITVPVALAKTIDPLNAPYLPKETNFDGACDENGYPNEYEDVIEFSSDKIDTFTDFFKECSYTDNFNVVHEIIQSDIIEFLSSKKPKLVVSHDGILIFYTENTILATIDCNQYMWISLPHGYNKDSSKIRNIKVQKNNENEFVTVVELETNTDDKYSSTLFALNFNIDFLSFSCITATLNKLDI